MARIKQVQHFPDVEKKHTQRQNHNDGTKRCKKNRPLEQSDRAKRRFIAYQQWYVSRWGEKVQVQIITVHITQNNIEKKARANTRTEKRGSG